MNSNLCSCKFSFKGIFIYFSAYLVKKYFSKEDLPIFNKTCKPSIANSNEYISLYLKKNISEKPML